MNDSAPSVTIIGAGIAGMSAALRLLQAGCHVTVIERARDMGGQFGAVEDEYRHHEHAFHIFADWCQNFFKLCSDIGLKRPQGPADESGHFSRRPFFSTLEPLPEGCRRFDSPGHRKGYVKDDGRGDIRYDGRGRRGEDFKRLEYLGSPKYFWKNANAGVAHWSDMAIFQYSILDLLSDDSLDNETTKEFLNRVSVNGFMHGRKYATDIAAMLHHELLLKVFAVPSYRTSARSYQTYLWHTAAFRPGKPRDLDPNDVIPSFWAMRGNVHETFWKRFKQKLDEFPDRYQFRGNREVVALNLSSTKPERITSISVREASNPNDKPVPEPVYGPVLVAASLEGFQKIIGKSNDLAAVAPELLDVRYLEAVPVPALNLYFRRPLDLPAEHITLLDPSDDFYKPDSNSLSRKNGIASKYGLSLVDHSQLWPELEGQPTVLSVLAGDSPVLMGEEDEQKMKDLVLEALREYFYFDRWDIDVKKDVHLQHHRNEPLFVNTVGSWQYRPETRLDEPGRKYTRVQETVTNLFLAGDYCRSKIDIVSLEGAIVTGISAAHLISHQVRGCDEVKPPIPPPDKVDLEQVRQAKAMMDGWIDLVTRRSNLHDRQKRARERPSA